MNLMTARTAAAAENQIRLTVTAAIHKTFSEHAVARGPAPVPQYVPHVSKGDTSGSVQAARLREAAITAHVTGQKTAARRVEAWQRQLYAVGGRLIFSDDELRRLEREEFYQQEDQEKRRQHERREVEKQAETLRKAQQGDARQALAGLERYLNWLGRHLDETAPERERLERRLSGARAVVAQMLADLEERERCREQLACARVAVVVLVRRQREALEGGAGAGELRWIDGQLRQARERRDALVVPRPRFSQSQLVYARRLVTIREVALESRRKLEQLHEDRERLLARARARVAATKRHDHSIARSTPGKSYLVTVPGIGICTASTVFRVATTKVELDLRAGHCTGDALEALQLLQDARLPVRLADGKLQRRSEVADEEWNAWQLLTDLVMQKLRVAREARELAA